MNYIVLIYSIQNQLKSHVIVVVYKHVEIIQNYT